MIHTVVRHGDLFALITPGSRQVIMIGEFLINELFRVEQ